MIKKILIKFIAEIKKYRINQHKKKILNSRLSTLRKSGKRIIFLFQTPVHTNIGDHAIAEAEIQYVMQGFSNDAIFEINDNYLEIFLKKFDNKICKNDIIVLHGGGNMGNEYIPLEITRRMTVEKFPDNKIIVFPQTVYYSNDPAGLRELKKTQEIFAAHPDLTLIARETVSQRLMQRYFPNNTIMLTPDIVLSMQQCEPALQRKGILMVMRGDAERILTNEQAEEINKIAEEYADLITFSDMHYHKGITDPQERKEMLEWKFNQFKSAELVITDRLHGMVFAAITGTPCIAFSNYNQKVSGTYDWIKDLEYIRFLQNADAETVEKNIRELIGLKHYSLYNPNVYKRYFDTIKSLL